MAINVKITKNDNENGGNVLRRFIRRVRSAGFVMELKEGRYYSRKPSKLRVLRSALLRQERTKRYVRLQKLGKVATKK